MTGKPHKNQPDFKLPDNFKDHILNTSQDLICIAGLDGLFKYLNPAWEELLGYSLDELMARPFLDFIHPGDHERNAGEVRNLASGKLTYDFENRYLHKDGSIRHISWRASSIPDRKLLFCIGRDITDHKQAMMALESSEQKFRTITENSADAIFITDKNGNYLYANRAASLMLQYPVEDLIQKNIADLCVESQREQNLQLFQDLLRIGSVFSEIELVKKDGSVIPVDLNAVVLPNGTVYGSCRDQTRREKAEQALKASETRYRELFNGIDNGVAVYETRDDGRTFIFRDFNPAAERIERTRKEDIVGKPITDAFPGVESFGLVDVIRHVWKTGIPEHHPVAFYQDQRITGWRENYVYRLPGGEVVAVYQDVTEKKLAEIKLQDTVRFYEDIIENVQDGIWVSDKDDFIFYLNKGMEVIAGAAKEEIIGKNLLSDFSAETTDEFLGFYSEARDKLKPVWYEVPVQTPAGKQTWQNGWLIPKATGDRFEGMICTIRDITLRKQTEQSLIQNEEKYRLLFENMLNGFALHEIVVDKNNNPVDYIILEINSAFEQMTGLKKEDIINKRVTEVFPGMQNDPANWIARYGQVALTGKTLHFEDYSQPLHKWYTVTAFSSQHGLFATVLEDITDIKNAELKIKQDLKEKEILLRELYHRTKNNMQVITSMIRLKARSLRSEEVKFSLHDIENKIKAMALVHQKLYESRDLSSLNLREYLNDLIICIRESILPGGHRIRLSYDSDETTVLIDTAVPLGLIINELLSNAIKHAFPDGRSGEIHVRLKVMTGNGLMIEVVDNGVGLPDGFDVDKHADLGLETVIDLVENQLNGKIEFENKDGLCARILLKKEEYRKRI